MTDLRSSLHGLWLPLVTPFLNGELDRRRCDGWCGVTLMDRLMD
jgi:hypothetical protein